MKLITTIESNDVPENFTGIVEYANGDKFWYKNGQYHREDGPAMEYANGSKSWFKNGQCHREDGPAFECANGEKHWYLNGKKYSESEFLKITKSPSCSGKIVEIDGKKYKLTPTE